VFCEQCGQENRDDAQFCDRCGTRLHFIAAPSAPDEPVALGDGRFRVVEQIGAGLRKTVYLAHDTLLDRDVALAVVRHADLDDAERTRAEREIRIMARLGSHPNVVTLYDVEDFDGVPGIVFEYLPGGSVRDLLDATGGRGLPVRDALRIGEQVAHALDGVHREEFHFRDLKPANVMLTGEGTAKLCDFGYVLRAGQQRVTDPELVVGSLAYIAPERVARRHFDYRSDLYSLGVLLYEMLAGEPPFPGDDIQVVGAQHVHAEPPPLGDRRPDLPEPLVELIASLLAKQVGERPESAAHVAAELARIRAAR